MVNGKQIIQAIQRIPWQGYRHLVSLYAKPVKFTKQFCCSNTALVAGTKESVANQVMMLYEEPVGLVQ